VVSEINVSGLVHQETVVRVSANEGVTTLAQGDDYSINVAQDKGLWSNNTYTLPASLFSEDGFYRIMFRSVDLADNLSENTMDLKNETRSGTAELSFAIDSTAPIATIFGIADLGIYEAQSLETQFKVSDNMAFDTVRILIDDKEIYSYTADGIETSHSSTFMISEAERSQNISLEVVDRAGNKTVVEKRQILVTSDLLTILAGSNPLGQVSPLFGMIFGLILAAMAAAVFFFIVIPFRRKKKKQEEEEALDFHEAR
jgi:hypothetical protein